MKGLNIVSRVKFSTLSANLPPKISIWFTRHKKSHFYMYSEFFLEFKKQIRSVEHLIFVSYMTLNWFHIASARQ